MLSERCGVLREHINQLRRLRSEQTMMEALKTRHEQLQTHLSDMRRLHATIETFKAADIAVNFGVGFGQNVLDGLRAVAIDAAADHSKWGVGGFATGELGSRGALANLRQGLRTRLTQAWEQHTRGELAGVGSEAGAILDVLARMPSMRKAVQRIRELQDKVEQRRVALPQDTADVEAFREDVRRLADAWAKLTGDGIPPQVLEFLRQAGHGGAPLRLVTPKVKAWLDDHQLSETFHVTIR